VGAALVGSGLGEAGVGVVGAVLGADVGVGSGLVGRGPGPIVAEGVGVGDADPRDRGSVPLEPRPVPG
jgi:hypothetical protein